MTQRQGSGSTRRWWWLGPVLGVLAMGACDSKKHDTFPSDYLDTNGIELACAGPATGKLTIQGAATLEFVSTPAALAGQGGGGQGGTSPVAMAPGNAGTSPVNQAGATAAPGYGPTAKSGNSQSVASKITCNSPWDTGVTAANSACVFYLRIAEEDTFQSSGSHLLNTLSVTGWNCVEGTTRVAVEVSKQAAAIPDDTSFDFLLRADKGAVRSKSLADWGSAATLHLERPGQSACDATVTGTLELTLVDTAGACTDAPCTPMVGFRRSVAATAKLSAPDCGVNSLELTGRVIFASR